MEDWEEQNLSSTPVVERKKEAFTSLASLTEPTLEIFISDPQVHGDGVKAYISYNIASKTVLPNFPESEFFVRRRYSDFTWLRNQLQTQHPDLIIPPLPEKMRQEYLDRFNEIFVEKRRKGLEQFLNRCAHHPELQKSSDLHKFLHAKDWELKTTQEDSEEGTMSYLFKNIQKSSAALANRLTTTKGDPESEKFENLRNYLIDFQKNLASIHELIIKISQKKRDLSDDYKNLGPAIHLLANAENELCDGLTKTGNLITDSICVNILNQACTEEFNFAESLKEYILMASAALEVVRNRDKSVTSFSVANNELENARASLASTQQQQSAPKTGVFSSLKEKISADPLTKLQKAEQRVENAEKDCQAKKDELATVSQTLVTEMQRFNDWKMKDFRLMLQEWISNQIEYHKKCIVAWESLLPAIQSVDKVSNRATWWVK